MTNTGEATVGLLHPGEMGAAIGGTLRTAGVRVCWASDSRSGPTRTRADHAGLTDVGTVDELLARCDVVLSVCPPHAALDVATQAAGYDGVYIDANAVAPATARAIAATVEPAASMVDGAIIGAPPERAGTTRLYLSGPSATRAGALFAGTTLDTRVLDESVGTASAVKVAYAAWSKGSAALLLAARALAAEQGVEEALLDQWRESQPGLDERYATAVGSATAKGWRWVGEMEEIAGAMRDAGLPDGFHRAAAEVYRAWQEPAEHGHMPGSAT